MKKTIVVGTGNKVEDFGVGFYTKYGDGGVDISPIADCNKTQVWELGRHLGVSEKIIETPPTDGLWDDGRNDIQQILKAKTGRFNKKSSSWIFSDGSIVSIDRRGQTTNIQFKEYTYPFVEGPMELAKVPKDSTEMNLKQAIQAEKIYEKTGNLKEVRRIRVRIQEKFTLPFACLVFGLIGSSLGSKSNLRSSKSQGFGLSVILILIYYVMSFIFSSFGVKGILTPILAAWLPVLISLAGGIFLLRKSSSF